MSNTSHYIDSTVSTTASASDFSNWVSQATSGSNRLVFCDFDGTLTPKHPVDSDNLDFVIKHMSAVLGEFLQREPVASGIISARSFGEVCRILELGLNNSGVKGFSSSEHGAVIFCPKLSASQESLLEQAGFNILQYAESNKNRYTIIQLATFSSEHIKDQVVLPTLNKFEIDNGSWASSFTHHGREQLQLLKQLSMHRNIEDTLAAVDRFGSGYIKIRESHNSQAIISAMLARAKQENIYALYSPPTSEQDKIHTIDFSPGTDKGIALAAIMRAINLLSAQDPTNNIDSKIPVAYFGDGPNDIPAFNYVRTLGSGSVCYLVGGGDGDTSELLRQAPNVIHLPGHQNIAGVRRGLEQFLSDAS